MYFVKTWSMRWDDIIRDVLFPETELAELMMIPADTDIITWTNKYFVDAALCTDLVEDEDVRVLWYEDQSSKTTNPYVKRRKICFDIYVKEEHIRDATNDLLRSRCKMIAQKLTEILTLKDTVGQVAFMYDDDYAIGTKTVGYVRHHLVLSYLAGHP